MSESPRTQVVRWIRSALNAVDPEPLTRAALSEEPMEPVSIVAIGKAAPGMCRGAAAMVEVTQGVCVTDHQEQLPANVELVIGDHPVPGPASLAAGRRILELVESAPGRVLALISGGGSALCEHPLPGVSAEFLAETNRHLLQHGASIDEINLVRSHLSAIKRGGLAGRARNPIDTYIISDVAGADPGVVASGPTVGGIHRPDEVLRILRLHGIEVPVAVEEAIRTEPPVGLRGDVHVIADGRTAANAMLDAVRDDGVTGRRYEPWLKGPVVKCLEAFISKAASGVTVGTGEPSVEVTGEGRGGRNTHAALLGAIEVAGTDHVFAAVATDGVDGTSGAAGAIVDGRTLTRGGDPGPSLETCNSADFLERSGDLLVTGPTGTNVADLWLLWKR